MKARFTIIFLLAATLPFCFNAMAQQQATPDEHDQHAQHEQHSGHEQSEPKQEEATQSEHDHSGHDMSTSSETAAEHEHTHKDHSIDAESHQEKPVQDHAHKDHSIDAETHEHPSEHDHDVHLGGAADHGDMHHHHHVDDGHIMDHEGTMIMGQNLDKLPSGCKSISEEVEITVRAGRKYAQRFPGTVFAFDQQQWHVKPCSKVTFHFTNEDNIRHQFMMHGLPRYIYQLGMFHLEVTGPKTVSGTIIVPGSDDTLLVHCDIAQHMEKGMKAQLVIGKGGQDIPSIPGLTPYNITDVYEAEDLPKISASENKQDKSKVVREITKSLAKSDTQNYLILLIGALIGLFSIPLLRKIIPGRKTSKNEE
ncbi:cupredoxin domain-containing protein [Nitrosomonas eutropha]|uniref:Copper oxidase n=1 Tax=Nitrosomonas eutropha (strain DSM 101675 / C91 / Nm57) TaxID=335283 RepID=Q0AEX7_NITEC|nr:cupredoxin domain-containing protein [Nitrosomonas eutropha]ABI60105.1 hypothetical protein Neut_1873 [Nitrosomonas eutropha C91]SCX28670.1 hypothetical protein SAMN05216379_1474 [Nitrosomonas eutropha]SEJ18554.1 hypothetical protein SAMN05216318_13013 [Nitrosomonas eutropha]